MSKTSATNVTHEAKDKPELPLSGNRKDDVFKVYPTDIGLLVAMLDDGTHADILQGNLFGYKGAMLIKLLEK